MKMTFELSLRTLYFRKPARTSRGEYTAHEMLLVRLSDGLRTGLGECAPLPDLSCDRDACRDTETVARILRECTDDASSLAEAKASIAVRLRDYPALRFAAESALAEMEHDPNLYDTPFARGETGIPVNGLVWMADHDEMLRQSEEKLSSGFRCIKFKIGAIGWKEELSLIRGLRSRAGGKEIQIRVDANGAFTPEEAPRKLEELAALNVHSIEQPIKAGQWKEMAALCRDTPVPIAMDEELIGLNDHDTRIEMLETVRPQYIVVKPTLHGGLTGSREWIDEASSRGIGSWITSALESNIGLKSISLLAASVYGVTMENMDTIMPQGLGTGLLFTENIDNGIELRNGSVWLSERMA